MTHDVMKKHQEMWSAMSALHISLFMSKIALDQGVELR
jgi:hypothetical protein